MIKTGNGLNLQTLDVMKELLIAGHYEAMYHHHYGVMEFRNAAPNRMFSPLQTWATRFVRPCGDAKWTCAACGKKRGRKWFWTQLVPFQASSMEGMGFALAFGPLLDPLTPVCADHILQTFGI